MKNKGETKGSIQATRITMKKIAWKTDRPMVVGAESKDSLP